MGSDRLTIEFHPSGQTVQVEPGTLLRDIEAFTGIGPEMPCGGKGRCGKCAVIFREGAPPPTPAEVDRLTKPQLLQGYRLACQTAVDRNAVICVPDGEQAASILTTGSSRHAPLRPSVTKRSVRVREPTVDDLRPDLVRVMDALDVSDRRSPIDLRAIQGLARSMRESDRRVTGVFAKGTCVSIEPGDTTGECFGAAVDVGTTTIAAYLMDLNSGDQVALAAAMNPQTRIGDDVVSRISYADTNPDGLQKLNTLVIEEINSLLGELAEAAGIPREQIYEVAFVGNTCMTHLLLGTDPRYLAQAPYVPVITQSLYLRASDLGVRINGSGRMHVLPSIAGYVGGDTVGVVLATALNESDVPVLAVDIGTNGEIVLASSGRIVACSTAAGPAFEGAHIRHGMRAAPGAIDSVWLDDDDIRFTAAGGAKAAGICGSGLLDAIVVMLQAGIVEPSGRIVDAEELPPAFVSMADRIVSGDHGNEFVLAAAEQSAAGGPVVITQRDVREVQLAKAAIAAGIQTLMERLDVGVGELDHVVLAGAFGNYVRKESAVSAGLIPDLPSSKVHSVGNAAGEGAKLALTSLDMREEADRIANSIEYIELTTDFGFQGKFTDALMFGPCGRT